jgi:hypothetical protein
MPPKGYTEAGHELKERFGKFDEERQADFWNMIAIALYASPKDHQKANAINILKKVVQTPLSQSPWVSVDLIGRNQPDD